MIPARRIAFSLAGLLLAGCALRPRGEAEERTRAAEAGKAWIAPTEPPPLPAEPGPEDYLRQAFLANADLQARYWEWRSEIERVPQASSFPAAALSFSEMFGGGGMTRWDRTTLGISNDPMSNIPFPTKPSAAGRAALEGARAAGLRFEAEKFRIQREVLSTYYDLALHGELIRIEGEGVSLLQQIAAQAAERVKAGSGMQTELLKAQTELDLAENALKNHHANFSGHAARLNALLGRPTDAPVPLPKALPAPRPLPAADGDLLRLGAERSPELAARVREIGAREEALALAKQAWLPDFGLSASLTGSVSRTIGGMAILPTRIPAIRAGIEQARADLKAAEAARSQYGRDLAASFVLNLYVLHNDERQIELFGRSILPRARQAVDLALAAYTTGRGSFLDLADAERTLLDSRLMLARLKMEREKALAAIESWTAVDVETMGAGAPRGGRSPIGGMGP